MDKLRQTAQAGTEAAEQAGWVGTPRIDQREYSLLQDLVRSHTGIDLGPRKQTLVEARLQKRLRVLGLSSYADYYDYLRTEGSGSGELAQFVNAITTNETSFLREPHHFHRLSEEWLGSLRAAASAAGRSQLRIWSACCSTGEEPYSIAITVLEALGAAAARSVRILASDINSEVLDRAAEGVYPVERVAPIPQATLARWFERGRGASSGLVRVRREVRELIVFRRLNLLDERWGLRSPVDLIFCRNALIYFNRDTRQRTLDRFVELLHPRGLLVLGHAESIHRTAIPVEHLGHTTYRRA